MTASDASSRRRLILIADDDADTRQMYAMYLEHVGFAVATAVDGEEALVKARELRPDAIVMDMTMPRVDGWTATSALKSDESLRRIPVIAVTGHAGAARRARESGCDQFCLKPCLPEDLVSVIEELLPPA